MSVAATRSQIILPSLGAQPTPVPAYVDTVPRHAGRQVIPGTEEMVKVVNSVQSQYCEGTEPTTLVLSNLNERKLVNVDSSTGSVPVNKLVRRSSCVRGTNCPKVEGNEPARQEISKIHVSYKRLLLTREPIKPHQHFLKICEQSQGGRKSAYG